MGGVRRPAVAGMFYPDDPRDLARALDDAFADAREVAPPKPARALIAPHAGYIYSGAIAASAYRHLPQANRVVVLGPSHRVPLQGLAVPSHDSFATPLGEVPIDVELRERALTHDAVRVDDAPHAWEHSLEVQLPFLQRGLSDGFTVLPLSVGRTSRHDVAAVIDALWSDDVPVVVSTDLSHYLDYATAVARDRRTAQAVVERVPEEIDDYDACGAYPLRGLLTAAAARGLEVTLLDLRNSGDTAGDRSRVVGYGAFALG